MLTASLAIVLIAVGAAIGSTVLKSTADEEQGLLGGHLLFKGTHPTCTQQSATSFLCKLQSVPTEMTFWADGKQLQDAYLGVKAGTIDSHHRVDGGCVSTSTDGRTWQCYLGQDAVKHHIIDAQYLGQYLPEPPTG